MPQSVPEKHKFSANLVANRKNEVVAFTIDGRLHFIERVADYEERQGKSGIGNTAGRDGCASGRGRRSSCG